MSYSSVLRAIKTSLDTSTHLDGYPVHVLTRIDGRNSFSYNARFGVEICVPNGVYTQNANEAVTDNDETSDPSFGDTETHTFKIRCRELRKGHPDHFELFDADEKTILTLTDKIRNALADEFFGGTYIGFEYGPIQMVNEPGEQAEWVTEFDFKISEMVDGRNR